MKTLLKRCTRSAQFGLRRSLARRQSHILHRPCVLVRHHSNVQTQTDTNSPSHHAITTCTKLTRPASNRGTNRPNLNTKFSTLGQTVDGDFTLTKITPIESYDCTAYEFVHNGTGARYIHLDTADTNNAFAVSLRTLPSDNSGVAHILEHTVLCGSRQYPVRDPFFHMLKRSLNTFMNAMTSADWTCYPFATQNEQDYHNLISVYLDSVFFPNLNELDFMQEGHRFEFESDPNVTGTGEQGELSYKGVVYNEMKGNMSDPNDIFGYNLQKNLFPDNLYQYNFGGDPPAIPQLTHAALLAFHREFYHPSNAVFYSYGDLGPQLQEIDDLILSKFARLDTSSIDASIGLKQPLFDAARQCEAFTPEDALVADAQQQHRICVSWVCNEVEDFKDTFGLTVLSQLLLHGPNAPFYTSLIKPNIGYGYVSSAGYTMDAAQGSFSVGLTNIKEEDCERVEKLILRTLSDCVEQGFDRTRIEAVLHQFEIDQRQRSGTFGLNLLFRMMSLITHRVYDEQRMSTPIQALQIDELLHDIKAKVLGVEGAAPTDPTYFQQLVRKYMVENTHRVTLVMKPDKQYMAKLETEEKEKLQQIQNSLSADNQSFIAEQSQRLTQYQAENNTNVDILPTLRIGDIPTTAPDATVLDKQAYEYAVYNELTDNTLTVRSDVSNATAITNDLSYFKLMYDLQPLFPASSASGRIEDNDFHLMLPLVAMLIGNVGAAEMDYAQLSQKIELHTGGIGAEIHAMTPLNLLASEDGSTEPLRYLLEISSFCLNRNLQPMLHLLEDCLLHPNYDSFERLETLLRDKIQSDITHLMEAGHLYAIHHAASAFGRSLPALQINEKLQGISQVLFVGSLSNSLQAQRYATLKEIVKLCSDVSYQLFRQQGPERALFVSDEQGHSRMDNETLMASFCPTEHHYHPLVYQPTSAGTVHTTEYPTPVFARKYPVFDPLVGASNKLVDKKYKRQKEEQRKTDAAGGSVDMHQHASALRHYFAVPSQVNYVSAVVPTVPYNHPDCAALRVAAKLLSLNFLHHEIREKNGAYGGGATQNKSLFAMFSYRDPSSFKTVQTFGESVHWLLKNENVTGTDIDEALLSLFGSLDAPKCPSEKGYQELLQDIDENVRQRHREQLLAVDKQSIKDVVDKYLVKPFAENEVAYSIVGKQDIEEADKNELENNQFKFVTLG